jgi:hypothetical protein
MIVEKSFHKLTPDQVREIRANYRRGKRGSGGSIKDLSRIYGVSSCTMHRVVSGQIYKETNA